LNRRVEVPHSRHGNGAKTGSRWCPFGQNPALPPQL
jgi:hypothetical protein